MTLLLRDASPSDAKTIYEFIVDLATYEKEPHAVRTTPETLHTQLESSACPFDCIIAEWSGVPCGFALSFPNYSTWRGAAGTHLEDLYVDPSFRGLGIGRALLRHLAAQTLERGGQRLEWAVLDWNTPAIQFYQRLGATPMDEWTTWRLTDDELTQLAES
ncbi:MAG: GNAT family N-acetyltransferase [Myxococcota bacterium]|nr:GNAT family N-acetyltransferase [Myxococcota bacterium]